MPPLPHDMTYSQCATKAEQDALLRSVLQRATSIASIGIQHGGGDESTCASVPTSDKKRLVPSSRRRRLKEIINAIAASQTIQANEMSRMMKVAISRTHDGDDDATGDNNDYSTLPKAKMPEQESSVEDFISSPIGGGVDLLSITNSPPISQDATCTSFAEFYTTPLAQDGRSTSKESPPSPPRRRTSFISSKGGDVSLQDLFSTINPDPMINCSPETTPEVHQFQYPLAPRYTSSWLSTLDPQAVRTEAIASASVTKQQLSTAIREEEATPLKSPDAEMARSSSKGALLLNRLAFVSKLSSSRSSTSLAKTAKKRLNKSFSSLAQSKTHHSGVHGEDNQPQANANWGAIPLVKSPRSSNAHQGNQASFGSLQSIIASAQLVESSSRTCSSSSRGETKQSLSVSLRSCKNTSPGGESTLMRLNKSLGSLNLVKKVAVVEGEGSPGGANANWDKDQPSKHPAVGRKSSLGNLRKKQKVLPAGLVNPSPNAEWG